MATLFKYPRTPHLAGSRLGPGDDDLEQFPLSVVAGRQVVIEEKLDGANCALSYDSHGALQLQSRGHFLSGGPRERQFELFKAWAHRFNSEFWSVLGSRYVLYGEWTYAKHTVFYDSLPHFFHEFDVLDTYRSHFLDTERRKELLAPLPLVSVPVLHRGDGECLVQPRNWVRRSRYKSQESAQRLRVHAQDQGLDPDRIEKETDPSPLAEGLYIKVEEGGVVSERFKWVRHDFHQVVADSGSHWQDRPILCNLLKPGVDLFV